MLSSTSLLHGNCIFNRNNTVATQQGMKTYWLCKSYRITMCRARCITHQGRVISATGVHNHAPHMKNGPATENSDPNQPPPQPIVITSSVAPNHATNSIVSSQSLRIVSTSHPQHPQQQHPQGPPPLMSHPPHGVPQGHLPGSSIQSPPHSTLQSQSHHLPISAVPMGPTQHMHHLPPQGMPPGMLNTNNLMHQHPPLLNPQHHLLSNIHPPPSLQITPVINSHLNNGIRMSLPPPPPPNHLVQSMHESPSPNHSLIQQPAPQQNQSEDSQTTMSDGHGHDQESMMQMEMTSQQQLSNQNSYKMEHGM